MEAPKKNLIVRRVIILLMFATIAGLAIYYFFIKPVKTSRDFVYAWLETYGAIPAPGDSGSVANQMKACQQDAAKVKITVTDELFLSVWYQWLTDHGVPLPKTITDRSGATYTPWPENTSDRPEATNLPTRYGATKTGDPTPSAASQEQKI